MDDEYENGGCEMNPELCEEEFDQEGKDFAKAEREHFGEPN